MTRYQHGVGRAAVFNYAAFQGVAPDDEIIHGVLAVFPPIQPRWDSVNTKERGLPELFEDARGDSLEKAVREWHQDPASRMNRKKLLEVFRELLEHRVELPVVED